MISLNDSITQSIHDWPTLYACRTDVLHQYFCVNGNGMEWKNGVLVDGYGSSTNAERDLMIQDEDEKVNEAREMFGDISDEQEACIRIDVRLHNTETTFRRKNANLLALVPWRIAYGGENPYEPKNIYPLCKYACMNEVPDDVQPDWLAGVREMIFWVFRSKIADDDALRSSEQQAAQHAENIAFADGVLRNLHERFGSPEGMPTNFTEYNANKMITKILINRIIDDVKR